jgi:hypothetical protein
MAKAAIKPEDDITNELALPDGDKEGEAPTDGPPADLGAFKDFLESLDLDDLDDSKS